LRVNAKRESILAGFMNGYSCRGSKKVWPDKKIRRAFAIYVSNPPWTETLFEWISHCVLIFAFHDMTLLFFAIIPPINQLWILLYCKMIHI
jgi:hypothetical protein